MRKYVYIFQLRRWKYQTDRVLCRQKSTTDRGLAVNAVQGWGHSAAPEVEGRIREQLSAEQTA